MRFLHKTSFIDYLPGDDDYESINLNLSNDNDDSTNNFLEESRTYKQHSRERRRNYDVVVFFNMSK